MTEEWKCIKGFEGAYSISNTGKIRHKSREMSVKNSKGWYLTARLYDGKIWHTKRIHRLVYETFVGAIPKDHHVHHIDGNKQNNRIDNLMILPISDHMKITANDPQNYAAMVYKNKFCQKHIMQYTLDGRFVKEYINAFEAGKATGICHRNISQVATKEPFNKRTGAYRKQAGGYIWRFKGEGVV